MNAIPLYIRLVHIIVPALLISVVGTSLPRDREIHVICRSGQRAYYATRILLQHGYKAKNISGGMLSLAHIYLLNASHSRP